MTEAEVVVRQGAKDAAQANSQRKFFEDLFAAVPIYPLNHLRYGECRWPISQSWARNE